MNTKKNLHLKKDLIMAYDLHHTRLLSGLRLLLLSGMFLFCHSGYGQGGNPGPGGGPVWQAVGSDTVRTSRFVDVLNTLRADELLSNGNIQAAGNVSASGHAYVDSVMNAWQVITADALSVGGNFSVAQNATIGQNLYLSSLASSGFTLLKVNGSGKVEPFGFPGNAGQVLLGDGSFGHLNQLTGWAYNGNHLFNQNTGNIGIGTSNPTAKVHIVGDLLVTSGVTTSSLVISERMESDTMEATEAKAGRMAVGTVSGSSSEVLAVGGDAKVEGDMAVTGTMKAGDLDVDGMVTFDSLRVIERLKIGLNSLEIGGSPTGTGDDIVSDQGEIYLGRNTSLGDPFADIKVGIGTQQPERSLHVWGQTETCPNPPCAIVGGVKNTTYIRITDEKISDVDGTSLGEDHWDIGAGNNFTIQKESERTMFIISDNNRVGVGAGFPSATLHVSRHSNDPAGDLFRIDQQGPGLVKFVVKDTGNVGIGGISNPAQRLHVIGSAIFENNYGQLLLKSTGSGSRWAVQSHAGSGNLNFRWASNDSYFGNVRMTITQAGNVGIGTTNPGAKLDVHDGAIRMSVGGNEKGLISFDGNNNGVFRLTNSAGTITAFIRSGSGNSYINAGNVGIGTTTPQEKLHVVGKVLIGNESITSGPHADFKLAVDGKVVAKHFKVTTNSSWWSDFVFDDDYYLMPLPELEKHIKRKRHLPGVPNQQDVLDNGIDLARTMAVLLQKIEENTLYIIHLNKENETLKKENTAYKNSYEELLKRVEKLEKRR